MKLLTTILYVILLTVTCTAKDWSFKVHKDSVRLVSSSGTMEKPSWFISQYGLKNMANLSFFTGRGFIPPYKDDSVMVLRNPLRWPYLCIGDSCYVNGSRYRNSNTGDFLQSRFVVSGYPILVQDGNPKKIHKSFFTRRVCPRTAVGITEDGYIIIFVTTASNLKTLQQKMLKLGCVHAINLDGGSSTFLYVDGIRLVSSKQARTYPNVLTW